MQGRNNSQCSQRFRRLFPGKVRKSWTPEEDDIVCKLFQKYSNDWQIIANFLKGRTGKQVRERLHFFILIFFLFIFIIFNIGKILYISIK